MSTNFDHSRKNNHYTFEAIDRGVQEFDFRALSSLRTPAAQMERLVTVYATVRPILLALTEIRFIPKSWRAVLTIFTVSLDEVSATLDEVSETFKAGKDQSPVECGEQVDVEASESFKAGKDQSPVEGDEQVEMEPKLPVG